MRVKLHTDFCWMLIWSFNNTLNIYCIDCTNTDRTAIPFWQLWKCVSCLVALSEWYVHVITTISLQIIGLPNNFVEYNDFIPRKCQVDFAVWIRMNEIFCNNSSNYCLIVSWKLSIKINRAAIPIAAGLYGFKRAGSASARIVEGPQI